MKKIILLVCSFMLVTFVACGENNSIKSIYDDIQNSQTKAMESAKTGDVFGYCSNLAKAYQGCQNYLMYKDDIESIESEVTDIDWGDLFEIEEKDFIDKISNGVAEYKNKVGNFIEKSKKIKSELEAFDRELDEKIKKNIKINHVKLRRDYKRAKIGELCDYFFTNLASYFFIYGATDCSLGMGVIYKIYFDFIDDYSAKKKCKSVYSECEEINHNEEFQEALEMCFDN